MAGLELLDVFYTWTAAKRRHFFSLLMKQEV